jgi:hypothetical protein
MSRRRPLPATADGVAEPQPDADKRDAVVMMEAIKMRETMTREESRVMESRRCRKGASASKVVKSSDVSPSAANMRTRKMPTGETSAKVAAAEPSPKVAPTETAATRASRFCHSK